MNLPLLFHETLCATRYPRIVCILSYEVLQLALKIELHIRNEYVIHFLLAQDKARSWSGS